MWRQGEYVKPPWCRMSCSVLQCVVACCSVLQYVAVCYARDHSNSSHVGVVDIYSQLQIGWHRIWRLFLKTFNLVPGLPGSQGIHHVLLGTHRKSSGSLKKF